MQPRCGIVSSVSNPAIDPTASDESTVADAPWGLRGRAILDLGRSDRAVLEMLEPMVDVRAAAEWGGLMDGQIELRDEGVVWVPGENARKFGFIAFRVPSEDVIDIRVVARPSLRGAVDIDLTNHRKVVVRVPDPERWESELDRLLGA